MYRLNHLARVAAFGALVGLAACENHSKVLGPVTPAGGDIFTSYVALGNSITAGFQSNGINDSTQRQSFARLLAAQMGTQYHYASLAMPGCPPPIANGLTGALLSTATPCALRTTSSVTDALNNVAVPGARVLDPSSPSTVASNALTTFILGGKTQVSRALDARPTFATIWIGNNDVLSAGLSGILVAGTPYSPGIVSTQAQFQTSYDAMIKQLTDSAPGLRGVLIGVVQVSGVAAMSPAAVLASPAVQTGINAATGKTVVIQPNCTGSTSLLEIQQLLVAIKAGTHPATISCDKTGYPAPLGDLFVLDPTEQVTLSAAITGYNNYIAAKAASIGFAYYDPNPLLVAQHANGAIPAFPNLASSTATFGTLFSLDGVHPAAAGHILIANDLITAINAKYGTTMAPVK
ncbi:MAG: SGNH/GDSL hydrolase family protein [bacterium]